MAGKAVVHCLSTMILPMQLTGLMHCLRIYSPFCCRVYCPECCQSRGRWKTTILEGPVCKDKSVVERWATLPSVSWRLLYAFHPLGIQPWLPSLGPIRSFGLNLASLHAKSPSRSLLNAQLGHALFHVKPPSQLRGVPLCSRSSDLPLPRRLFAPSVPF